MHDNQQNTKKKDEIRKEKQKQSKVHIQNNPSRYKLYKKKKTKHTNTNSINFFFFFLVQEIKFYFFTGFFFFFLTTIQTICYFWLILFTWSYPGVLWLLLEPSWIFGVCGGTGDPPESSDGVFDKNKLPPSSDTNVIGELHNIEHNFFFSNKKNFQMHLN